MPFDTSNAPAVFQALVNDILWDILNCFVFVYLDDILVSPELSQSTPTTSNNSYSNSWRTTCSSKWKNVTSMPAQSPYWGNSLRVKADPEKIQAVVAWPRPTTLKQRQCFLGFAYIYRRFLRDYRQVAAPLNRFTSTHFVWTPEREATFTKLKE